MCPSGTTLRSVTTGKSEFKPAFDVLDADHDGKISRDDLRTFYATTTTTEGEDFIDTMMSVADTNNDGFVEYDEFERVLNWKKSGGGVMEDVFKVMDTDGDGKVSFDDLKSYLNLAGFSASDDDIIAMIRLGGGDEDHGVTYDGLIKILAVDFGY